MRHLGQVIFRGRRRIVLFILAVLLPSVALSLLALRAFRGEQVRDQYRQRERQQQILRLLESDLRNWIVSLHERTAAPEDMSVFEVRQDRIVFPRLNVYLSPGHMRDSAVQLAGEDLRLWQEAQVAEVRGRKPAVAIQFYRNLLSRSSPLSSRSRLALLRLSLQGDGCSDAAAWLGEIREKDQAVTTESGIPIWVAAALLLIDHDAVCPPQQTTAFLTQTLSELESGRWQLNAAQWIYYVREIKAALDPVPDLLAGTGAAADFLESFTGAFHQVLALRPSLEWRPSQSFAALHLPELQAVAVLLPGKETNSGFLLADRRLLGDAESRLKALTAAEDFEGHIGMSNGIARPAVASLATFPFLEASFSAKSQTLWRSHIRRYLIFYATALLLFAAGVGLAFTYRAVAREMEVSRMKAEFVSSVSHEFRTPLSAIEALLERLESGKVRDEEMLQRYYRASRQEVHRLTRMVNQLLDFARLEEGRAEFSFEMIDLNGLAVEAIQSFRNLGFGERLLHASDMEGQLTVSVDKNAVYQCIHNLIDNALKYSPKESPVTVRTGRQEGRALLQVKDQGPGVAPAEQSKIFEQFYRVRSADAGGVQGAGIGLALVKRVMEAHGGGVTLESRPGEGSTFQLDFPGDANK